jgi:hypothetical protein
VRWISISLPKPQIPSPTVFAGAFEVGAQQKKIECLERRMGALKALNCERDLEHLQQTTTIAMTREKSSTLELLKLRQTKQGLMIDG